ncbi:MAG TPA: response regulator, partial [Aquabacterium sp.]|nr:response regulator [Aquabacterium sp.]
LLDITMDDMDGWATARAIREAGLREVPIIMVSANVFENRSDNLKAAGCQDFVAKPVIESELLDTLAKHLHLRWGYTPAVMPPPAGEDSLALNSGPDKVPTQAAQELTHLARMGHIMGLKQAIEDWQSRQPELQTRLQRLQPLIEQFDLDGVIEDLALSLSTEPEDE